MLCCVVDVVCVCVFWGVLCALEGELWEREGAKGKGGVLASGVRKGKNQRETKRGGKSGV